jgi:hypothetical protein
MKSNETELLLADNAAGSELNTDLIIPFPGIPDVDEAETLLWKIVPIERDRDTVCIYCGDRNRRTWVPATLYATCVTNPEIPDVWLCDKHFSEFRLPPIAGTAIKP